MTDWANIGLDRFEQSPQQFRDLADRLDRYAELGGIQTEIRSQRLKAAAATAAGLPSPTVASPRIDGIVRRFGEYCRDVEVPEVQNTYRAVRDLARRTRDTADIIERCEVHERNWLDQFGHDRGRDWDKAWHHFLEPDRSEEVNREYDRLAREAQARSAERADALQMWASSVNSTLDIITQATAALSERSAQCPVELLPPCLPGDPPVKETVRDRWYERSVVPFLKTMEGDDEALRTWWDVLTPQERAVLRARNPELGERFQPEPLGPGDVGFCTPEEFAVERYIGGVHDAIDLLGLPAMPTCAQDIPLWLARYRHQLTTVHLPFVEAVTLLRALSDGMLDVADKIGVPREFILACNGGDELACVKVGVSLGMAVPTGGFRSPSARHSVRGVNQRTVAKNQNTVVAPGVNVNADVQAINSGQVPRIGNTYTVNGRTYGSHDGTLYPIRGEGFAELDRPSFKALGVFNTFGDTPKALDILQKMGLPPEAIDAGRRAWEVGR